ncbi:MAG: glycosyltransferase family 4 protein [Gemmatimonadetes bacterium]|nr:glycosyltransferase family 4 protein [Gemmatimonadota bacterium]MBI2614697.1 glycosyltransferase family 4 protein [Gemmatimonadota bacterium]
MRILHVVTAFPRSPDDVIAPWLVELLRRLRAAGHEVEVLTSAYKGGGNRDFDGIPIHRFRYFPAAWEDLTHDEAVPDRLQRAWRYRLAVPCYVAGGVIGAWRWCRRRRYDVVHVHWPVPHALFGWVARAACGARLVTTFYGVELRWVKSTMPWLRGFLARAAKTSDRVVAISHYTAREIRELADVPIAVIPYTTGLSDSGAASPTSTSRPGVDRSGPFTILFVGRLVARKGIPTLIEAVRRLRETCSIRVVLIGEGPERPALEAEVARAGLDGVVELRGRVPPDALARAYQEAGALVLPAIVDLRGDTEGLGVVLLEAMSYGTPVVASDLGGITDIVAPDQTGLLVPPGDPVALAGAIERLARDTALWHRLADAGRRRFRDDFSWPSLVRRWDDLYREAVRSPGSGAPARG